MKKEIKICSECMIEKVRRNGLCNTCSSREHYKKHNPDRNKIKIKDQIRSVDFSGKYIIKKSTDSFIRLKHTIPLLSLSNFPYKKYLHSTKTEIVSTDGERLHIAKHDSIFDPGFYEVVKNNMEFIELQNLKDMNLNHYPKSLNFIENLHNFEYILYDGKGLTEDMRKEAVHKPEGINAKKYRIWKFNMTEMYLRLIKSTGQIFQYPFFEEAVKEMKGFSIYFDRTKPKNQIVIESKDKMLYSVVMPMVESWESIRG